MKKRFTLMASALLLSAAAMADVPQRPMLEQGKTWWYDYHHFEERDVENPQTLSDMYDHVIYPVAYTLSGDTIIDGRQYMKMYQQIHKNFIPGSQNYFGAYREDEEGRVFCRYANTDEEMLLIDFTLNYDGFWSDPVTVKKETIKQAGQTLLRYKYQSIRPDGTSYMLGFVGVEGVGFYGSGLVDYLFAEHPNCICDYQEFSYVTGRDLYFTANDFRKPRYIELTDNEKKLVGSNNDFAFNLFRQARGDRDATLSPLSITYALGMLNNGAAGQTQQEINQVLGFGEADAGAVNEFCHKMMTEGSTLDDATKVLLANNIYMNEGYELQPDFIQKANAYYDVDPETRDFTDGQTRDVINQWASDHTEGMITEVLKDGELSPSAVSYLLNALYFKGEWTAPFSRANTKEEPFNGGPTVPMMHIPATEYSGSEMFAYEENELYQAVVLPYGNRAYAMTVFLPREGKTIGDVLQHLNGNNWKVNGYHTSIVDLKLPRFETDTELSLKHILAAMGMPSAFDHAEADFSNFCYRPTYISQMKQVAKIKLDEQGTEAAAVTIIGIETSSEPSLAQFHANRPFLYVISEQQTGVIFFIGQYVGAFTAGTNNPNTTTQQSDNTFYNLAGQKLTTPPASGFYIRNGRKYVK